MERGSAWLWVVLAVSGCATEAGPDLAPTPAPLEARVEAVRLEATTVAPEASDAPPRHRYGLRGPDGVVRPIPGEREALAAVVWRGEPVLLGPDGALLLVHDDGAEERLAEHVPGPPATSDDGALLVYAERHGERGDVILRDAAGTRTVARGVPTPGAFRVTPDGSAVLFVSAAQGGVAGLFVAPVSGAGARCLTNCDLVTGRPWGDRFVPLPPSPAALAFDGDLVRYLRPDGQPAELRWGAP